MMQERRLDCELITPLFANGAYKKEAEFRTSEIKGLMRYMYRIACPSELKILKADEERLFGGAAGSGEGVPSPIRLQIHEELNRQQCSNYKRKQKLLLHDKKPANNNPIISCKQAGEQFQLIMRMQKDAAPKLLDIFPDKVDMKWYEDLIVTSFSMLGIGKRSRKGRGSLTARGHMFAGKTEALKQLCAMLNRIAKTTSGPERKDVYQVVDSKIGLIGKMKSDCHCRPLIQKVEMGGILKGNELTIFMKQIDKTCHDWKAPLNQKSWESIGENERQQVKATGSGRPRLASPLIISLLQTREGYYPIYTYVQSVSEHKILDIDCKYRDDFRMTVEAQMGGKL